MNWYTKLPEQKQKKVLFTVALLFPLWIVPVCLLLVGGYIGGRIIELADIILREWE